MAPDESHQPHRKETIGLVGPKWCWGERFFLGLAIVAFFVGCFTFGPLGISSRGLNFLTLVSLAVAAFAVYLALRIFRNQTLQAEEDREAQHILLDKIEHSSSAAADSAGSAENNTAEIIELLNEAQQSRTNHPLSEGDKEHALAAYAAVGPGPKQVLWVDDNVSWIRLERKLLESAGVATVWVPNTARALELLNGNSFDTVITDMRRAEGDREGYALLDAMRGRGCDTPLLVYSTSREPKHVAEVLEHGGQGATNHPTELFELVMRELA